MEYIPVKTRVLQPPQDDLLAVLLDSLPPLVNGDVVAVSSKVVAIDEGRCVPIGDVSKEELVADEAELLIDRPYQKLPLTVRHGAFISNAGIDESNAAGHYVLLPEDPFASAQRLHTFLCEQFGLTKLGVIIVDSHSAPLRRGAVGISIGFWGIEPVTKHKGKPDLFGREIQYEVSNIVDGLAAGATVVMGEVAECQPAVIIRGIPDLAFTDENKKDTLVMDFNIDSFRVLYERFLS